MCPFRLACINIKPQISIASSHCPQKPVVWLCSVHIYHLLMHLKRPKKTQTNLGQVLNLSKSTCISSNFKELSSPLLSDELASVTTRQWMLWSTCAMCCFCLTERMPKAGVHFHGGSLLVAVCCAEKGAYLQTASFLSSRVLGSGHNSHTLQYKYSALLSKL